MQPDSMLGALFEQAPVGQAVWDAELRYAAINDALARINGFPAADHIGRTPAELLGEVGVQAEAALRSVFETGADVKEMEFSGETPAEPGVRRHWVASFFPLGDGVGGVVVEDTARHQAATREHEARRAAETARARAEALTRVTAALGSSMRTPRVLAGLVDAVVPSLADVCAVHLVRDGGRGVKAIAVAAADRRQTELARALADLQAADGSAPVGPAAVARTGTPEINVEITPADLLREGVPGPERDALAALDIRSAVVLPLSARGVVLGSMTLAMGSSGRHYTPELVEFAEGVASGAGLALDNARLFAEQEEVARALQRTLLPPELPEIPGVRLAARYRASGRANDVGGDFYDVFDAGDGEWALVIGDVVGKGAAAAALTSLVRATLRAAVLRGDGPLAALELADEALRRNQAAGFCSALHGRVRAGAAGSVEVRLLVAGHPPPLILRAGGALEEVAETGTLLGVVDRPVFGETLVRLAPGDAMLLYTDGATELRGGNPWRGEQALRDTVRAAAGADPAELVERVEREALVLSGGELRDDLALLAVAAPPDEQ
ncbi:MAG TPA: SpoIIE family protein phosphatase [Solirubrobacteraceae bacterium]|nr:SpoIIE family protein phosphatase [Solirubrobacteraceae bacterium]